MINFKKEWNKYYKKNYVKKIGIYDEFLYKIYDELIIYDNALYYSFIVFFTICFVILLYIYEFLKGNYIDRFISNHILLTIIIIFILLFLFQILFLFIVEHYIIYVDNRKNKLLTKPSFSPEINLVQFNQFLNDVIFNQKFKIKPEYQEVIEEDLRLLSVYIKNNLASYDFSQTTLYKIFIEYINANIQIHTSYLFQTTKLDNIINDIRKLSKSKNDDKHFLTPFYYSQQDTNYLLINQESIEIIESKNQKIILEYQNILNDLLNKAKMEI